MEKSGFFDANLVGSDYDRVYLAENFAEYFASFIGNGVFSDKASNLQCGALSTPAMTVAVLPGQAWINGYWYSNTETLNLMVEVADGVLNRIDSVVVRLNFTNREIKLAVKKGVPATSPIAPTPSRDADYYELQLATISVPAGAISIKQADITDTRFNKAVCGIVAGVVDQIDTSGLFAQYNAEFNAWFDEAKGQLSGDVAGNLLNQIDQVKQDLDALSERVTPVQYGGTGAANGPSALNNLGITWGTSPAPATGTPNTIYIRMV